MLLLYSLVAMVVPEIPQLHESLVGLHIKSTDIDSGSFNSSLVCSQHDKPGAVTAIHPGIKFDQPVNDLRVMATGGTAGKIIWDAKYNLAGKSELVKSAVAVGGDVPQWTKVCTPSGDMELYTIQMTANGAKSGVFNTSVSFTANNGMAVQVPRRFMVQLPIPAGQPANPIIVPVNPDDFNPLKFL